MNPPITRTLPALLLLAVGALIASGLLLAACGDDDTDFDGPTLPPSTACANCPDGFACVLDDGVSVCLRMNCGTSVCAPGATCVNGACAFVDLECSPACPSGQTCIHGNCITAYTSANVCDPWQECSLVCSSPTIDAVCLSACDQSRSSTCVSCLQRMQRCEARDNCTASSTDCCASNFCECFPNDPGCSATPCDSCNPLELSAQQLQSCLQENPFCQNCLSPAFFTCRDDAGGDASQCTTEACACLSSSVEPTCN